MAEISRRAGVGSATLYRNFANRRELLEALYVDEIDAVCEAAATIDGATPGAIFTSWLRRFFTYFTSKRLVAAELLEHSGADDPVFGAGYGRVLNAGRPLLLAARKSGEVRGDLTLAQVLDMVAAIAKIPGDAGYREPILQAALDALSPVRDD
jgi:AcrR family transcriptional regulator